MAWTWRFEDESGAPLSLPQFIQTAQATQSDAESWLGEIWRELAEAGVAQASLYEDDRLEYGPMSLSVS
jgi:hypothetical protein